MTVVAGNDLASVYELAQQLRVDAIRASSAAGSGHPTSSMSAADLMAVLLARHLRYDWDNPDLATNDHLVFSKGHASPLLYAMFKAAGAIGDEELISTYRRFGSRLQGHPTPALPWVKVATGSLGQGLPYGVGIALAGRYLDELPYHVWVLCGDSEMTEGSMWEAIDRAAYYRLGNLTAIVDVNRLGQRGPTELGWDLDAYRRRVEAFGAEAFVVDGHDLAQIDEAFTMARSAGDRPTVVLARTRKGRGFSEVEDAEGWHGRALPEEMAHRAVLELGGARDLRVAVAKPPPAPPPRTDPRPAVNLPVFTKGERVATRKAYGQALVALGVLPELVVLDGEVSNSTHAEDFKQVYPERFFEMFIAEQQLLAAAVGLSVRGYLAFASTFGAFWSRAYDFLRMTGISGVAVRLCGSHAGVEIGADGPSQMALEDLAALRAVHGSTVLYPADATATVKLVAAMAELSGLSYLRTTRGAYPVLYGPDEEFPVGGAKLLRASGADQVTLVGAGVTVHECLAAADELEQEGVACRVIDAYSVKPIDARTLGAAAEETGRLVVVEDHYPEGGLGSAVLEAFAARKALPGVRFAHLAVRGLPGSGSSAELLDAAGIARGHVAAAARALLTS